MAELMRCEKRGQPACFAPTGRHPCLSTVLHWCGFFQQAREGTGVGVPRHFDPFSDRKQVGYPPFFEPRHFHHRLLVPNPQLSAGPREKAIGHAGDIVANLPLERAARGFFPVTCGQALQVRQEIIE